MESCECLSLEVDSVFSGSFSGILQTTGLYNGFNTFEFIAGGTTYYIWYLTGDWWVTTSPIGDTSGGVAFLASGLYEGNCPVASKPEWSSEHFTVFNTSVACCPSTEQDPKCCCLNISYIGAYGDGSGLLPIEYLNFTVVSGWYNGMPYYEWCNTLSNIGYILYLEVDEFDSCRWIVVTTKCGAAISGSETVLFASPWQAGDCHCPFAYEYSQMSGLIGQTFVAQSCEIVCVDLQDRHQRKVDAIQLPQVFIEQDRGFKICCDPLMVLASGDPESWKNDVSSAWIKVSDPADTFSFILEKDGIPVTLYALTIEEFPNEDNAYYTTIQWKDVLALEGPGCYELKVSYSISGILGDYTWAKYNLLPYSIQNALKTARIRVKFNLKQELEGINFTGANVEDSFRFWGFIGDRQTNTEIDNLTYQDRVVKTVVRENLDSYIISTDPLQECFITPLTDLYLLSENEMWISDYNSFNHSYRILDIPVVVEESPEIDYLVEYQRRAVLTCQVGLRDKNRRTYY